MKTCLSLLCVGALLSGVIAPAPTRAEHLLKRGDDIEYLGFKVGETHFKPCGGQPFPILSNDKVVTAPPGRACAEKPDPILVSAEVLEVDPTARKVTVRASGKDWKLPYPADATAVPQYAPFFDRVTPGSKLPIRLIDGIPHDFNLEKLKDQLKPAHEVHPDLKKINVKDLQKSKGLIK